MTRRYDGEMAVPEPGDFDGWEKGHGAVIAVDWDGTCRDTMAPKWTKGFNVALTRIWPQLAPYQREVDEVCRLVNMVEETAGVQRFVALKIMMGRWAEAGLPAPELGKFFEAVDYVEAAGERHSTETYRKYRERFGYDDSALRWSDLSDEIIAEAVKDARVFDNCRETLAALGARADLVVVSASKTEAVVADIEQEGMESLFRAVCAQDFLPKAGTLAGLTKRYGRVLFVGDTNHDRQAAREAGVALYLVETGDENRSWAEAGSVIERYLDGGKPVEGIIYS